MNFKAWFDLNERYSGSSGTRITYYHGTSSKYLNNILSQGLIPDSKEKSWDQDNDTSFYQPDRSSYGGIYVTTNFMKAYSSAGRTARKNNSNRLIVVLELQSRSLLADEDSVRVPEVLNNNMHYALQLFKIGKYGSETNEYKHFYETSRENWINDFIKINFKNSENKNLLDRVRFVLSNEGFLAILTRIVSFETDLYEWRRNWNQGDNIPSLPSRENAEIVYKTFVEKITRLIKPVIHKDEDVEFDSQKASARIMTPVRYNGSNKITAILEIYKDYSLKLHYGKLPQDFYNQFKNLSVELNFI